MNAGRPLSAVTALAVIVAVGGLTTACGSDGTSTETSVVTVTTTSPPTATSSVSTAVPSSAPTGTVTETTVPTGTLTPTESGDDDDGDSGSGWVADPDSYVNFPGFTLSRDKRDVRSACCPAPSTEKAIGACPTTSPG